ncbi:copper resistance protein CopC [Nocardioides iriomotensis]|uniref:Copper resistance protein CopC n=1 Tax=Nocardioides iriomotensis TaxID=715784 RepID=A0A4Q5J0A7_9ACTN|nr:copper resistance protein CopC [Nocardioides iriomotensis]RYU10695.1 copper resistance protein CopC [Nocardioides iriomotensis]
MTRSTRPSRGRLATARVVLAGVLALVAVVLAAVPASAHASLVSTDPAEGAVLPKAPERITLTFDEPVSLSATGARLFDAAGDEVEIEAASRDRVVTAAIGADLADGTYVLSYRVVSADSHPIAGSLSFSVGAPSETVVPPSAGTAPGDVAVRAVLGAVQGVGYAALLLAAGLLVFLAWLLPTGPGQEVARARSLRVALVACTVAVVALIARVPLSVLYQQGLGLSGLDSALPWTSWVSGDGLMALLAAAGLGAAVLGTTRRLRYVAAAGSAVAVGGLAVVGHTRSYGPVLLVVPADVAHVAAAAVWLGGLVGLAISLPTLAKRDRVAAETIGRFSLLAGGLLAVVAAAGLVLGWRIIGSWSGLVGTAYGLVLLFKTGIVGVVALVAAWNRWVLVPRVVEASGYGPRLEAARMLRGAVRTEAGLLVVVLLLTGFLVNLVPRPAPSLAAAERTTVTAVADDVKVVAHVGPGRVGRNTVHVQVQDLAGEPVEPYATPTVALERDDVDLGTRPLRNVDSGTYVSEVVVPQPGTWEVRVSVRTSEFDNPVLTLDLDVEPGG